MSGGLLRQVRFMLDHRWTQSHLSDYLDGDLADGPVARVEAHLEACPDCGHLMRGLQRVITGLRSVRGQPDPAIAGQVIESLRAER